MDRRKFLTVSGVSLGAGALYTMAPLLAGNAEGAELARQLGRQNGERPTPFTVFQLSDTHVGWDGALGTKAFERAVEDLLGIVGEGKQKRRDTSRQMVEFDEIAGEKRFWWVATERDSSRQFEEVSRDDD